MPESKLSAFEAVCHERGLRLTAARREVLELLVDAQRPLKAYDLLDLLRQQRGARVDPPTVYRALDFLVAEGFAHRLESMGAFLSCDHPHDAHQSSFLICDVCQHAEEIDDPALRGSLSREAERRGFVADRHNVEVHGVCADCQESDPA